MLPSLRVSRAALVRDVIAGLVTACVAVACSASPEGGPPSSSPESVGVVPQLAFNVWSCENLECLDLETLETTSHAYTACAAIAEDAHEVGVRLCEGKQSGVVSQQGNCAPMGVACPVASGGAYNWDDHRKRFAADGGALDPDAATPSDGGP